MGKVSNSEIVKNMYNKFIITVIYLFTMSFNIVGILLYINLIRA